MSPRSPPRHTVAGGLAFSRSARITALDDNALTKLRRSHIGFIFQFFNLLPMLTAEENILLPLEIAGMRPDAGWHGEVMEKVGLTDRRTHRPSELSGGQQQRVAVARAVVSKPIVMFADEPTGNLDSRTGTEILGLLRDMVDTLGQTTVMVTHDPQAAAIADRVLFLDDGHIVRDLAACKAPRSIDKLEPLLAKVAIPQEKFDESFPRPRNLFSFVEIDATPQNTAALRSALQGFPELKLDTEAGWVEVRSSGLNQILNLFYVLLALSVIVSLFGMVNTLILSVFERTRELGMLRAVGMTRRQVRRMVRQESVITALIGAAVGLPLGMFLALLVSNALADEGIGFSIPWGQLVAFTIVAFIAGVLAAIVPARRAAKLNVLRALQYE